MGHPRHDLDSAFQTPIRLSLMAALLDASQIDFGTLRDLIEADDSAVSKGIAYLEREGYVTTTKGYVAARPRTWIATTAMGRAAYARHLTALRAIAEG
ncbi:transcriptional regulator [Microbacterium suaedae]|uniref:transcriptional regulator n=1 Tax=Microbacterium suaedae TaxID=2067813 RepID=UPI000DA1AD55|nr:transcriptional regulator [Microbacterium suaedae]